MTGFDEKPVLAAELAGDRVLACARLLSKAVTAIYDDKLRPFGITSTQFTLLTAICQGPITRVKIARLHHLNKSTLTRDLKAVVSAGWIEEVREGANGRSKPVALTSAGRELLLNAQPAWITAAAKAEALVGDEGVNAIRRIRQPFDRRRSSRS